MAQPAQELAAEAAGLAGRYHHIGAVGSLGVKAHEQPERVTLGLLARNGAGKSSLCDMVVLSTLHHDMNGNEEGELREGGEPAARCVPRLVWERPQGEQTVEQALADGKFRLLTNPAPFGCRSHLKKAFARYEGYYKNDRSLFGGRYSVLLPIGDPAGSTTQAETRISHDVVAACCIITRNLQQLESMAEEALDSMRKNAEEKEEEEDVKRDNEFKSHARMFGVLTGHNMLGERSFGQVLEVVQAEQEAHGTLLRPALVAVARELVPVVLAGAQEDLSSDVYFIKQALADPLAHLASGRGEVERGEVEEKLRTLRLEVSKDVGDDGRRSLQGLLVDRIEVTVPCPSLGLLELVDMPGLADNQPTVSFTIAKTLSKMNHVALIVHRNISTEAELLNHLTLKSAWLADQLADRSERGSLHVLHVQEVASDLILKDLYSGIMEEAAAKIHAQTERHLREEFQGVLAPRRLSVENRRACINRFIEKRIKFITVHPATFCSLGSALPADVCDALRRSGVDLPPGWTHAQVADHLMLKTNMHKLLESLGQLSCLQDRLWVDSMSAEVVRVLAALPAEAEAAAVPPPDIDVGPLENWVRKPAKIDDGVVSMLRGASGDIKDALRAQLEPVMEELILEYQNIVLSADAGLTGIAAQAVTLLKESPNVSMAKLRRLCLNQKKLAVEGLPDVVGMIAGQMKTSALETMGMRREAVLQAHHAAAEAVAQGLAIALQATLQDLQLRGFLLEQNLWQQQLVSRITDELDRAANIFLDGSMFDDQLLKLLHIQLRRELKRAENAAPKFSKKSAFWAPLKVAFVRALGDFRDALGDELKHQLGKYLDYAVWEPLFQNVRSTSHVIMRMESEPAQNHTGRLAQLRARQPCLFRCVYRFYKAALSLAQQGQAQDEDAEGQLARVGELREELQLLHQRLAVSKTMYSGAVGMELRDRLGRTLAHRALQNARQLQVAELRPKKRMPSAVMAALRPMGAGGRSVYDIDNFAVHCDEVDLPAGLAEDTQAGLQEMFNTLARHSIYCDPERIPNCAHNSALAAGWLTTYDKNWRETDNVMAHLRNLVSSELCSDQGQLEQDLARVQEYSHTDTRVAAYLGDLDQNKRWTGLLELKGLAVALRANFIVCTTQAHPGSTTGRMVGYFIHGGVPAMPGAGRPLLVGYPIALVMRAEAGRLRPWFLPLFHNRPKSREAEEHRWQLQQQGGAPGDIAGPSGNGWLRGTPEDVQRMLAQMAESAALAKAAAGAAAPEGGRPYKRARTNL